MHFSDDDLRSALERKSPSPDFTQRVMAQIGKPPAKAPGKFAGKSIFRWWRPQWAVAAALAACLLLALSWIQYHRYQQRIEAQNARKQVVLALRITSEKVNGALRQALFVGKISH